MRETFTAGRPSRIAVLGVLLAAALAASSSASASVARGSAWTRSTVVMQEGLETAGARLDSGLHTAGTAAQQVIVSGRHGAAAAAEAVRRLGGTVGKPLEMIDGVSATVPADRLVELSNDPAIGAVTANTTGTFSNIVYDDTTVASSFTKTSGANTAWSAGNLGAGVGVAVLDTGISSMNDFSGRIVYGPDLSGEGTTVDSLGHGTVMAGAIAGGGNDSAGQPGGAYVGVAPKATLVSVKVAGRNGVVDVATILQAMHWVSAYKDQFNIRVLNLSWGTASKQDPAVDPLNYAVERLWRQGIVVVVAAGNSGNAAGTITKPGDDPLVITAGAYDDKGTLDAADDSLPQWTSRGPTAQGLTKPDLVSPGRTIITARSYGSYVEANNPKALISPSYIKGSGTSQAAAVTSGLAALVVAANPGYTPDQVKRVLTSTANPLAGKPATDQGAGRVNLAKALIADPGPATSQTGSSSGLGSIEASRGGYNVTANCAGTTTLIKGEIDNRCEAWDGSTWTGSTWTGSTWTGSTWTGSTWTGSTWTGSTWTGSTWTGSTWTGSTWTGSTWTGSTWTTAEYDEFLTAFWGNRPGPGKKVRGENNDPTTDDPR